MKCEKGKGQKKKFFSGGQIDWVAEWVGGQRAGVLCMLSIPIWAVYTSAKFINVCVRECDFPALSCHSFHTTYIGERMFQNHCPK